MPSIACKRDPANVWVVARSGPLSLFAALEQCCPSAIRNFSSANGRRGLTMIEFNKALEKAGFEKMRDRRSDATTRQEDPTGGEILCRVRAAHLRVVDILCFACGVPPLWCAGVHAGCCHGVVFAQVSYKCGAILTEWCVSVLGEQPACASSAS